MSDSQLNEQSTAVQSEQTPDASRVSQGPGAQLAVQRQARGFTVEQVANQLNLAPRQIQALEADNYAALPGIVIARGFVRAYAKLLKIDPEPLVSLMQGDVTPMESIQLKRALSGSFSESHLPPTMRSGLFSKWVVVAALLVLIVVGGFAAHWFGLVPGIADTASENADRGVSPSANGTVSDRLKTIPDSAVQTAASSANEMAPSNPVTKDEITTPPPKTVAVPTPATAASPDNPLVRPAAPVKAAPTAAAPISLPQPEVRAAPSIQDNANVANNKNMLVMKLREDSWIEVKSADNNILISRLMKAGTTEMLAVTKPVSLTVGNVAGVDITLRGNAVDLKAAAKSNVARLNLK